MKSLVPSTGDLPGTHGYHGDLERPIHPVGGGGAALRASKQPLQIPSLDGLRAVSFLLVFVAHSGLEKVVPGGFGVTTFFFLSGFLITTLMRLEDRKTGTVSLKGFYLRRIFRILPPFYLTLILATSLALVGVVPGKVEGTSIAALMLHFGNYWFVYHGGSGVPAGTAVYWSL